MLKRPRCVDISIMCSKLDTFELALPKLTGHAEIFFHHIFICFLSSLGTDRVLFFGASLSRSIHAPNVGTAGQTLFSDTWAAKVPKNFSFRELLLQSWQFRTSSMICLEKIVAYLEPS